MATNLSDLPVSPQSEEAPQNVQLETKELNQKITNSVAQVQQRREADDANMAAQSRDVAAEDDRSKGINQLVSGIQQAAAAGALQLPSRDIPQTQDHLTQDSHVQPNFVPPSGGDYIREQQTSEEIIRRNAQRVQKDDSLDALYNQLQIPITIGVLYFLFQLPIIKKTSLRLLPMLFHKDGNPNLSGYLVQSVLFAIVYYASSKAMNYMSV